MLRIWIIAAIVFSVILSSPAMSAEDQARDDAQRVLYIFAHQDDEALIIAKMAYDLHVGKKVYAIWVTDGAGTAPPKIRKQESIAVMKHIGVPVEQLFFLNYPDRDSWKYLDDVLGDVTAIAGELQPAEITSNAYEGGNIDHDVVNLVASITASRLPDRPVHYDFPLYNSYKGSYRVGEFIPFDGAETQYTRLNKYLYNLKNDVLDYYESQAAIIQGLKMFFPKKELKKYGEPYRVAPEYDYRKPPADEAPGYEMNARNPVKFKDWESAVVPFLESLGL